MAQLKDTIINGDLAINGGGTLNGNEILTDQSFEDYIVSVYKYIDTYNSSDVSNSVITKIKHNSGIMIYVGTVSFKDNLTTSMNYFGGASATPSIKLLDAYPEPFVSPKPGYTLCPYASAVMNQFDGGFGGPNMIIDDLKENDSGNCLSMLTHFPRVRILTDTGTVFGHPKFGIFAMGYYK